MKQILSGVTAVLAFALELAMLAAFGYWTANPPIQAVAGVVLGIGALVGTILIWATFLAPKASRRLPWPWRVPVEAILLASSALVLAWAGQPAAAVVFGCAIVIRVVLGEVSGADRVDEV